MTEYLYSLGLNISIEADSRDEADMIIKEVEEHAWIHINESAEVWGSTTEFKGLGDSP